MKTPNLLFKKTRWVVIAVVVLALGGALAFWLSRDHGQQDALRLYGNVDIREVQLAFRQPGRVMQMAFDEGDAVSAGARLAALDAQPYREALAAAQAQVQVAQAELAKLRRGLRPQEITQAREALRQAQALATETERNFQRRVACWHRAPAASARSMQPARRATRQPLASKRPRRPCRKHPKVFARKTSPRQKLALRPHRLPQRKPRQPWRTPKLMAPSSGTVHRTGARTRQHGRKPARAVYSLSLRQAVYVRAYVGESDLGAHRAGYCGARVKRFIREGLSRPDRLHLAARRVHTQDGGDD
jgi:HlyD family secretion protein